MKKITKRFFPEKTKTTNRTQNFLKVMILLLVVFLGIDGVMGQSTVPTAYSLSSGSYTLSSHTGSSLPANMAIGSVTNTTDGSFTTDISSNATYNSGGTAGSWDDEGANGISYQGSGSAERGSFLFRAVSTNRTSINVAWTVRDISASGNTNYIELQWRSGGSGSWTNVTGDLYQQGTTASGTSFSVTLPSGAENLSDLRIRWIYYENGTGTRDRLAIDDITVSSSATSCSTPDAVTSLAASVATNQSNVTWTNGSCFDEMMLVVSSAAFTSAVPTGDGTAYTANSLLFTDVANTTFDGGRVVYKGTGTSATVTSLTNGTLYNYKVFTRKGSTWTNATAVSQTPAITYCASIGPATQGSDYFTNFTTTGGSTNITNTSTFSANGYGNFTAQTITQIQGGTVNYSATSLGIGDGSTFSIFVDWNQDGDFTDAGEEVVALGASTQITTNPSGSFTVPEGATLGNTRMRIIIKDATGAISSCNSALANSETEDYTFNVTTALAAPTLTAAVNPTVDASFNVTFTDNSAWRAAITSITVGGTTLAAAAYSISAGQIAFTPSASALLQSSGAKTIVVLATGYSNATVSQTILAGIPANLGITTQPTAPSANGGTLAAQPVIRIRDQYNNTTTSTASVTATAVQGTWTLGGTTAVSGLAGTTTFSGLTATSVGLVTGVTIQFTSPGLTSVTSNTFSIPAPVVDFVSIAALGTAVTENFNGMAATTSIPFGFGIQDGDSSTVSLTVGAEASSGSPISGASYNWGQSASERALGLMFSGSYSSRSVIVKLRNNTGTAVSSFTIGFDYEQYRRNNGVTQTFKLQYSTSLTSGWVDVTGGAFTNIVSGASSYGYSSLIASQNISNLIYTPAASISPGSDVYFRWILDGGSSSRGVGIDNFSITAKATPTITTPPTATAIALGQTLANSTLSGGATSGDIAGTFTFTTPSTAPLAGTASQGVTFTPSNTTSYNTATTTASVTVSDVSTWNNGWDFGLPSPNMNAIIAAPYGTNYGQINVKNLTVNSGVRFTVNGGANGATISESIVNNGFIVVEMNANLIQTAATNTNTAAIDARALVHRNSNPLKRLDYTLWSSPVSGSQTLGGFSPLTIPSRNYVYRPDNNVFTSVGNEVTFTAGKGYLIRMPDALSTAPGANLTDYYKGLATLAFEGGFDGNSVNNGPITIATTSGTYNAVGNPYPSTISADSFITANSITDGLYFWRKTNGAAGTAYARYTALGGAGTTAGDGGITPNGTIQVGQGFIVKAPGTSLVFNNQMRLGTASTQFFKTKAQAEKSRIWLNLHNSESMINQTLVGYLDGATNGIDNGIDGKSFGDGEIELASNIDGESYTIQGRPAFDATDVVSLNFKTSVAGTYTIAIDHVDGLFSKGQAIYLVDKTTGTTTNLNEGAYTFTAEAGVDNTRFTLTYQKTLKIDAPLFNENSVLVSRNNGTVNVKSAAVAINNVKVFDVQGRLVAERKNVKSNTANISNLKTNQVLIVKVTAENNAVVTKKVLN